MAFPCEGRWTRSCPVLVQGCVLDHFSLLVLLLVKTKQRMLPLCLLSEKVLLQVMIAQDGKVMSERCFEHCQSEVKPGIWWMAVSSYLHYIHSVFRNANSTYIVFKLKKLQNIFNFRVLFSWQNFPDCFLLRKNFHQIEYIASNVRSLKEQVCSCNQLRNFQMHCLVETSWAHRA